MKSRHIVSIFLISLIFGGCASTGHVGLNNDVSRQWLLSGAVFTDKPEPGQIIAEEEVTRLSPAMKDFADQATAGILSPRSKVGALLAAVVDPMRLGIEYSPEASYTAAEAFEHRRANCLSFTLMMVSMLRHLGVNVRFNDVDIPQIWDLHDDSTMVLYKHINAIVQYPTGGRSVIDLTLDEYDTSYEQRIITDRSAVAQYFNNRAVENLNDGNVGKAFPFLVKALAIEPHRSYWWSNLGSLYQKAGYWQAARQAYEIAMAEDDSDLMAMSNAVRLYTALGDDKRATELQARVDRYRQKNPYYRYLEAINAYRAGELPQARDEIAAAIRLYEKEHRFYFLQGAILQKLGLHDAARRSMDTALELTTDRKQVARYREKMDLILSANLQPEHVVRIN